MSGVDNKVVKMTFDNAQFQKNVSETMSALDKLKASLNFDKVKNSMGGLNDTVKKIDLAPMATQVEGVNAKFLALAAVGTATLVGLASQAANAGAQIVKSLALDPVIEGYKEYEVNIDSIQTILANTKSKGTTIDDVNKALDEMNVYSDKTIYNFAQMAKNVSKFTAAGVDLETSVSSIKGLANVAALSGVKNEEAQRAMFQLSQAIGSGTVKLKDWISVENASMSSEGFRDALFETGKAMGTITNVPIGATMKEWEASAGSFRETLQDGWLTSEVLTTALGALAGDLDALKLSEMGFTDEQVVKMVELGKTALESATNVKTATQLFQTLKETMASGWSTTFRTIVGDFIEAKGLFTNLNNFIGGFISRSTEARNKLLAEWKFFGGRQELMSGLMASLGVIQNILRPIGEAFRAAFPKKTSEQIFNMTKAFNDLALKMLFAEGYSKRIKQIFTGVFSIMSIGWAITKGIARVFWALGSVLFQVVGAFSGGAGSIGDFIGKMRELLVDSGGIEKFFDGIVAAIGGLGSTVGFVRKILGGIFDFAKENTAGVFTKTIDTIKSAFDGLISAAGKLGGITGIFDKITAAWQLFVSIMKDGDFPGFTETLGIHEDDKIVEVLFNIREAFMGLADVWKGFISIFKDGDFIGFGKLLKIDEDSAIVDFLFDIRESVLSFYESVMGIDIGGALDSAMGKLKDLFKDFDISASAEGVLTNIADFFENLLNTVKGWDSISEAFTDIREAISNFFGGLFDDTENAGASAGKNLTEIPNKFTEFANNLWNSIKLATAIIRDRLKDFWETIKLGLSAAGVNIDKIFGAIGDSFGSAGDSIGDALGTLWDKISGWFKDFNFDKLTTLFTAGLAGGLVTAIYNFSKGFKAFGEDGFNFNFIPEDLVESVTGTLDRVQKSLKTFQNNLRADTLMKIAIAFGVLTVSIIALSFVDADKIAVGMGAIAAGIATIVGAMAILAKVDATSFKVVGIGVAISLVAASVLLLAAAVFVFGRMDPDTLKQGLIGVGIALTGLVAMAVALSKANGSFIRAAIAIGILSGSLILMAQAIKYYADIDLGTLAKGGYIITGVLISLAVLSNIVDGTAMQRFSIGLGLMSISLWGLVKVVEAFAALPFWSMIQGLIGIAAVLGMLMISMRMMPNEKRAKAGTFALIGMAAALWIMAKAIETVAKLSTGGLIVGVLALIAVLAALTIAAIYLGTLGVNVGPMLTLSVALAILAGALYLLGQLDVGQVLIALGAIAGVLLIFVGAGYLLGPVVVVLLAFGAAMALIGAGFLMFGAGLALVGVGLLQLSKITGKAAKNIGKSLVEFVKVLPRVAAGLAEAFVEFIRVIGKSAGQIADAIGDLIIKLLEKVQEMVPVIGETLGVIIEAILVLMEEKIPRFIEVGIKLLTSFMTGVRDNIGLITTLGLEILTNFLDALTANVDTVATAIGDFITSLITAIGEQSGRIVDAGTAALVSFLSGISDNLDKVITAVADMIEDFIVAVGEAAGRIIDAGVATLVAFLWGLVKDTAIIAQGVKDMINAICQEILNFLFTDSEGNRGVIDTAIWFVKTFLKGMGSRAINFVEFLGAFMVNLLNGLAAAVEKYSGPIQDAAKRLGWAVIDGMTFGLAEKAKNVYKKVEEIMGNIIDMSFGLFKSDSPSKVFWDLGNYAVDGLALGLGESTPAVKASKELASSTIAAFGEALSGIKYELQGMDEFNPTITPVLDLTQVSKDAKGLSGLLGASPVAANLSIAQAQALAASQNQRAQTEVEIVSPEPASITFEQNNYSPKPLSANDIYRGTRSQIATAKEALGIP